MVAAEQLRVGMRVKVTLFFRVSHPEGVAYPEWQLTNGG